MFELRGENIIVSPTKKVTTYSIGIEQSYLTAANNGLCSRYGKETAEMFREAFENGKETEKEIM